MRPEDLRVTVELAHKEGGQHAGLIPQRIMVEHIPTGLRASAEERSQHRSRAVAMAMIEYGLAEIGYKENADA